MNELVATTDPVRERPTQARWRARLAELWWLIPVAALLLLGARQVYVRFAGGPSLQGEADVGPDELAGLGFRERPVTDPVKHFVLMAVSRNGKRIVSSCTSESEPYKSEVSVWDAESGRNVFCRKGIAGYKPGLPPPSNFFPIRVAISADGRRIAYSELGTIKLLDVQTGRELLSLQGRIPGQPERIDGLLLWLDFSPDGKCIAAVRVVAQPVSSDGNLFQVWDVETGQEKYRSTPFDYCYSGFSSDGRLVVFCIEPALEKERIIIDEGQSFIKILDPGRGKELQSVTAGKGLWHQVGPGAALSLNGERFCVSTPDDKAGTMRIYDVKTGLPLTRLQVRFVDVNGRNESPNGFLCAAFSPDSSRIAVSFYTVRYHQRDDQHHYPEFEDKIVQICDAATGKRILSLIGHTGIVTSLGYGPDGRRIYSAASDGTIKAWDAQTGRELFSLQAYSE